MATQPSLFKRTWSLVKPYWKSEERWMARLLLGVIVGFSLGDVYISVLINHWYNDFYNALQAKDETGFWHLIGYFCWLATIAIIMGVYRTYLNQMLRIRWRRWLTARYLSEWLAKQNYYRMQWFGSGLDNPDQRISEDIDQFITLTLGLALDGLSSVVTLFSFLTILWTLSGALDFTLNGIAFHISGYMVWVAFVYAVIGSWFTFYIGRPLAGLNFMKQRYEADFRFSLVRLRENSESVAFYQGETQEQVTFLKRFTFIVDNWWQIMKRQKKLNWFTNGYGQVAIIFPFMVAAPRFFSGQIQLGGLMQISSAFGQVQGALSYIVNSYIDIASWKAVMDRLTGFHQSIATAEAMRDSIPKLTHHVTQEKRLEAKDLRLLLPDGRTLLEHINLTLKASDSLLITGISGVGKSTLLRALAGLWPFMEGELTTPGQARMLFVPQKPYLPLGTLRQALCYPESPNLPEAEVLEALSLCGLSHLVPRLDEEALWANILSLGEQQRVAFARVLLARPDFLFLDEATSALDEPAEARLYGLIREKFPSAAIVSVGHRSTLKAWHARELALSK